MTVTAIAPTSLVSVPVDPRMRDATPADAPTLALALARELNRQIRSLVDSADGESDDPFALATRGRDEEMRRKRILLGGLNGLKAAHARYTAVFDAWQTACAEMNEASEVACGAVNVNMAEIGRSLGITVKSASASNAPMSELARERRERQIAEREIDAQILDAKIAAKGEIEAAREARKAAIEAAREARKALKASKYSLV